MEIDNENDRCLIKLLLMKGSLTLKDRVFLWFLKRGLPNYSDHESKILKRLSSDGLVDYNMKAFEASEDSSNWVPGLFPEKYHEINDKGRAAIYGRIYHSENVRRFNFVYRSFWQGIIALVSFFGGKLLR